MSVPLRPRPAYHRPDAGHSYVPPDPHVHDWQADATAARARDAHRSARRRLLSTTLLAGSSALGTLSSGLAAIMAIIAGDSAGLRYGGGAGATVVTAGGVLVTSMAWRRAQLAYDRLHHGA